ncbi:MAG TPA: HAD family hydrolase, partial [Rhodanobacter sp.]
MPALELADRAVDDYLREHWPEVARAWPIPAMRELRARVAAERPDLAHDFTTQRRLTQQHAFAACGIADAPLDALWEVYYAARNAVQPWPDSLPAL